MFIFGFGVEGVSRLSADFPCWVFCVTELIGWNVIGTFRGLFAITVNKGHLLGNELFGLCVPGRGPE